MFSFGNPFVHDFARPKSSFGSFFDDDFTSSPFSSGYYAREQPSLFRSSSFRQPSSYGYQPSSFFNVPSYQKQSSISEDEEDSQSDLFSDFFNLRRPSRCDDRKVNKPKSIESKPELVKPAVNQPEQPKQQPQQSQLQQSQQPAQQPAQHIRKPKNLSELRQMKLGLLNQDKTLVSTRYDTDSEVEFRFNYKCNDPSGIDVRITKDDYIELKTKDGYSWRSKLPDNVEISKASCTLVNNKLTLRLPKKEVDTVVKASPVVKVKCPKLDDKEETKVNKSKDEEFDPDAPIVEDIIEDDD